MFEPVRGGTRGGQAEFKWSDVSADKDRENYLGHSINAPTGRWQKNKDIHWYNRDVDSGAAARAEEIRKVKELEADALSAALGFGPATKTTGNGGNTSGANAVPVASTSIAENKYEAIEHGGEKADKEERRRRKEEKREEKRARKELKKLSKTGAHGLSDLQKQQERDRDRDRPIRHPSRSRSPRFRSTERRAVQARRPRSRSRSFTPPLERRSSGLRQSRDYDMEERERERERDRRRWDRSKRDLPDDRLKY